MLGRVLVLLAAVALFPGCNSSSGDNIPPKMPAGMRESSSAQTAGRELFMQHCARCHGTVEENRLQGSARYRAQAPDFTEPVYRHVDPGVLFRTIRRGRAGFGMPAWGPHFSEEQTWQLVAYLLARSTASGN